MFIPRFSRNTVAPHQVPMQSTTATNKPAEQYKPYPLKHSIKGSFLINRTQLQSKTTNHLYLSGTDLQQLGQICSNPVFAIGHSAIPSQSIHLLSQAGPDTFTNKSTGTTSPPNKQFEQQGCTIPSPAQ